jgi:hypothetical protein
MLLLLLVLLLLLLALMVVLKNGSHHPGVLVVASRSGMHWYRPQRRALAVIPRRQHLHRPATELPPKQHDQRH